MIAQLDDEKSVAATDKSGMLSVVERAAEQVKETAKGPLSVSISKEYGGIIFAGMGGSAIAGDILSDLFYGTSKKGLYVNRGYNLPASFEKNNLFVAISYSGDTEETLSALKEAESRGMQIVCLSSGGKLKEIAASKKHPFVLLPSGFQPRAAFYVILTTLLKLLEGIGVIPNQKEALAEAMQVLEDMRLEYGLKRPERSNAVKQLAQKIKELTPLIFASSGVTAACGLRMKCQFNENAKIPAFLSVFPELNHNELVGFSSLKKGSHKYAMLLLRDTDENVRINKRIEITKSLIGVNLGGVNELHSKGASRLARILSLVFFGDLLSVYTALLNKTDPTPVEVIGRLKKELKR